MSTNKNTCTVCTLYYRYIGILGDDFADAEALLEAVLTIESQSEEICVSTPTHGPSSSCIGGCTSVPGNPNGPSSSNSDPGAGNPNSSGIIWYFVWFDLWSLMTFSVISWRSVY
jgi:hypothetical protein